MILILTFMWILWCPPSTPGIPTPSVAEVGLKSRIDAIRSEAGLPALAVAAVVDGRLVMLEVSGRRVMGREIPVERDDHWHLGSCGKAMSTTVLARLVEAGTLSWDSTIGSVFEGVEGIHPEWNPVTLAQLVRHRSGLPEDRTPDPEIFPRIRALTGPLPEQRLDVVRLVLGRPPVTEPGTVMAYSNFGYAIASAMAERKAGATWESLCRLWLFDPLGMESAGFGAPGGIDRPPQPHGHLENRPVSPSSLADNPASIAAAGTIHANLKDWGRFLALHLGKRADLLSPAAREELHRPTLDGRYAAGWMTGTRSWAGVGGSRPGPILTHSGSNGLWFAVTWLAPERGWALMAVSNQGGADAARACDQAIGAVIKVIEAGIPEVIGDTGGDRRDVEASP